VVVLGLPRGGVPVAAEVARALRAPLDVFVVRKLGTPGHEELAMGAIASGGVRVLNTDVITAARVSPDTVDRVTAREIEQLVAREQAYRGARPALNLEDRVVIVVDDGMATGSSIKAALGAVRRRHPRQVVAAVPTGAPETCAALQASDLADELVCAITPYPFIAVGVWYRDFTPTTDEQVAVLVAAGADPVPSEQPSGPEGEQPHQR
jgi:putative phosphoribosyl transferase